MLKTERRKELKNRMQGNLDERTKASRRMTNYLEDDQIQSWRTLMLAFQSVFRPLERELQKKGCSVPRFQVLFHLYFHGPMAAIELAERLFVTRGNISMFLKRLESEGLTRGVPEFVGSKRVLLTLSPAGAKYFEKIFPEHVRRVKKLMPKLSTAALAELRALQRARKEV